MTKPTLEELCAGFEQSYSPAVADILDGFGLHYQWLGSEIRPLTPNMHVAGPAFTVRWLNDRTPGGHRLQKLMTRMIDSLTPYAVPTIDTSRNHYAGYWGELMCNICKSHQINGAVIDGPVRDPYYILKAGFNLFATGACPLEADGRARLDSFQEPIAINNVTIRPGDFIVGDLGGVLAVPKEIVADVYEKVLELVKKESDFRRQAREGITGEEAVRWFGPSL
jgi:regulator of RNase E activity RraA